MGVSLLCNDKKGGITIKKLWMRAMVGTAIVGGIGGATVAGTSAFNDSAAPEASAGQALQDVFSKVEGTVQEVELGLEDGRYYEVEVESSVREYKFLTFEGSISKASII